MHTLCILSTLYTHFMCTVRDIHFENSVITLVANYFNNQLVPKITFSNLFQTVAVGPIYSVDPQIVKEGRERGGNAVNIQQ